MKTEALDLLHGEERANVRLRETSPEVFRLDHDADRHDDRAIALALAATYILDNATRVLEGPLAV